MKPVTIGVQLLEIAMITVKMVHVALARITRNIKRITEMENWPVGNLSQFLKLICPHRRLQGVISLLVKVKCSARELRKDVEAGSQLNSTQILFLTLHGMLNQNLI